MLPRGRKIVCRKRQTRGASVDPKCLLRVRLGKSHTDHIESASPLESGHRTDPENLTLTISSPLRPLKSGHRADMPAGPRCAISECSGVWPPPPKYRNK